MINAPGGVGGLGCAAPGGGGRQPVPNKTTSTNSRMSGRKRVFMLFFRSYAIMMPGGIKGMTGRD